MQADHLFKNKVLSPEIKDRFAKRLAQFKQLKSDPYLKSVIEKENHHYNEGTFMNDFEKISMKTRRFEINFWTRKSKVT